MRAIEIAALFVCANVAGWANAGEPHPFIATLAGFACGALSVAIGVRSRRRSKPGALALHLEPSKPWLRHTGRGGAV